jgi:hypothetical protein
VISYGWARIHTIIGFCFKIQKQLPDQIEIALQWNSQSAVRIDSVTATLRR